MQYKDRGGRLEGRMIAVGLLLTFCHRGYSESLDILRKFGCPFSSSEFDITTILPYETVWGDEAISTFQFPGEAHFQVFVALVGYTYSNQFRKSFFNDIDSYIYFHANYNEAVSKSKRDPRDFDFENFFHNYEVKFHPNRDSASFTIDLLESIMECSLEFCMRNFPEAIRETKPTWYLVTASPYVQRDHLETWDSKRDRLPQFFLHDHVAGFLKFSVNSRVGYVLVDSVLATRRPIIIMEDGEDPPPLLWLDDDITEAETNFAEVKMLPGKKYVTVKTNRGSTYLYYIGKPFCSFLETTNKIDLLKPTRSMVKHDFEGQIIAKVHTNMEFGQEKPVLHFSVLTAEGLKESSILLESSNIRASTLHLFPDVTKLCAKLGPVSWPFLSVRKDFLSTISKDKQFLAHCNSMLKIFPYNFHDGQATLRPLTHRREYNYRNEDLLLRPRQRKRCQFLNYLRLCRSHKICP